jgi:protein SCO1/2
MTRKFHFFILIFLVGIGILLPFLLFHFKQQKNLLPVLGQIPAFALFSEDGKSFTEKNVLGKIWVADFIFTTCAGPCPIMTEKMSQLLDALSDTPQVHCVSISVNPDYDTPEILKKYGEKYQADFSRWHFLTGPLENIHHLATDGFKIGSVENPVFHSDRFVLVDSDLRIRGYYDVQDTQSFEKLKKDIHSL